MDNKNKQSISEIINEVREDICNNFCKYSTEYDELDDFDDVPEICMTKCPLDRL